MRDEQIQFSTKFETIMIKESITKLLIFYHYHIIISDKGHNSGDLTNSMIGVTHQTIEPPNPMTSNSSATDGVPLLSAPNIYSMHINEQSCIFTKTKYHGSGFGSQDESDCSDTQKPIDELHENPLIDDSSDDSSFDVEMMIDGLNKSNTSDSKNNPYISDTVDYQTLNTYAPSNPEVDPYDFVDMDQMVELVQGSLDDPLEQYMDDSLNKDMIDKKIEDTSESMLAKKIFYDSDDMNLLTKDGHIKQTLQDMNHNIEQPMESDHVHQKHIIYIDSNGRPVTKPDPRPDQINSEINGSETSPTRHQDSMGTKIRTPLIAKVIGSVSVKSVGSVGQIKSIPRVGSSSTVSGLGGFLTNIISTGASTIANAMGKPVGTTDSPIKSSNIVTPQEESTVGNISFDLEQRPRAVPINSLTKKRSEFIETGVIHPKAGTSPVYYDGVKTADRVKKLNIESRRISKWVEDNSVGKCFNCHSSFSLMLRRHHCRLCGRVFCYHCSNYFTKLPLDILNKIPNRPQSFTDLIWGEDLNGIVRTCSSCYSHANKLIRIRKIIKVFELCQFTIKDLNVLAKLSVDWEDAAKFLLSKFREIQYKLSIEELTQHEKRLLWINRNYLTGHSRWMVQLVKATDLNNEKSVLILEQLIYKKKMNRCWDIMCTRFCSETIGITDMLDLIRYNKNYRVISNFIVKCLVNMNPNTLKNYLSFLVYNIKNNNFILDILLDKGINDFKFMSNLYWCIKVYCPDPDIRKAHIITTLVTIRDRSSKDFRKRFKEMVGMEQIDIKQLHLLNEKDRIILPVCPETIFRSVDTENVKIMSSYSQPVILTFIDETGIRKPIMFKNDDVRKDYIVLNIIDIIHDILKREEEDLDIEMVRYEVMPTSQNSGYIEIVENAATIFNIIENSGLTIQNFILNNNKDLMIGMFREKFIKSTALYCVVSYLLGIGDRHLDNIMISKNGLLFHIDFGFILGQDPKYSNNRLIRVTPEIVNVIGGYGTEDYDYFKKTCVKIYNRLRLHVNLFSNLLSIIPVIDQNMTHEIIKRELTERFEIGENCIEAATHMDNKVGSKDNFEYMIIDFLYKSKKNNIFKGIQYVTGSLMSMLGNT
jgi:hypothetical protein